MRTFILYARKARTDEKFSLEDLPGSGGRMDLVARFVSSALFLSHSVRTDTTVHVVLNGPPKPPVTVTFYGSEMRRVTVDERSIAIWLQKALEKMGDLGNGIVAEKKSFQQLVKLHAKNPIYILHEKGKPLFETKLEPEPVFIIGDHLGMPPKDEKFAQRYAKAKISLGVKSYLASSVVSVLNWACDNEGV